MSNQSEAVAPQELRKFLLAELEASQQAIAALSDEELEAVMGANGPGGHFSISFNHAPVTVNHNHQYITNNTVNTPGTASVAPAENRQKTDGNNGIHPLVVAAGSVATFAAGVAAHPVIMEHAASLKDVADALMKHHGG